MGSLPLQSATIYSGDNSQMDAQMCWIATFPAKMANRITLYNIQIQLKSPAAVQETENKDKAKM